MVLASFYFWTEPLNAENAGFAEKKLNNIMITVCRYFWHETNDRIIIDRIIITSWLMI